MRKFETTPKSTHKAKERYYSVTIELTNKNGAVSRIELGINYICRQKKIDVEPLNSYTLRYDVNAPMPYIYSIDPYGEVKIRFNATMVPEAALNKTEIYTPGRSLKNIDFEEVFGVPT